MVSSAERVAVSRSACTQAGDRERSRSARSGNIQACVPVEMHWANERGWTIDKHRLPPSGR